MARQTAASCAVKLMRHSETEEGADAMKHYVKATPAGRYFFASVPVCVELAGGVFATITVAVPTLGGCDVEPDPLG